jgi:hypothetical protein
VELALPSEGFNDPKQQVAAKQYWPSGDPIGRCLTTRDGPLTVVGVLPETRYRSLRDPRPSVYFPLAQAAFPVVPMTLGIRASGRAADVIPAVRGVVAESERRVALAGALASNRLLAAMLYGVSATDAVTLGAVALFLLGVVALATLLPARSSRRIDPVMALRTET